MARGNTHKVVPCRGFRATLFLAGVSGQRSGIGKRALGYVAEDLEFMFLWRLAKSTGGF